MKETHQKILDYITGYMLDHGYPPTTREISEGVDIYDIQSLTGYAGRWSD